MKQLLPITAIGLSVLALGTSLWLGWTTLEHNRLSVAPYLIGTPYLEGPDARNGLYLANIGPGPAIINHASISLDGKRHDLSHNVWEDALLAVELEPMCFSKAWLPPKTAIKSGQEIMLLAIANDRMELCLLENLKLLTEHQVQIHIEYESLYGKTGWAANAYELTSARHDYARALRRLKARQ